MLYIQATVAFLIATVISWLELITSKYPRTYFLLAKRSPSLWVYPTTYGLIASLGVLGNAFLPSGQLKIEGLGEGSPWAVAVAIGFSAKALLHIRLFTVTVGTQPFPVGTETIVQIYEPWLLRTIALDEFNAVRELIVPRAAKNPDLAKVKTTIKGEIPASLPAEEKKAFELDVDQSASVISAMELFLRAFGRQTFNRVFPP